MSILPTLGSTRNLHRAVSARGRAFVEMGVVQKWSLYNIPVELTTVLARKHSPDLRLIAAWFFS